MEFNQILNKAVNGLSCCILRDPDDKPRCSECPYDGACSNRLKQDALYLLQKQQNDIHLLYGGYIENTVRIAHMFGNKEVSLPVWAITEMIQTLKDHSPRILSRKKFPKFRKAG